MSKKRPLTLYDVNKKVDCLRKKVCECCGNGGGGGGTTWFCEPANPNDVLPESSIGDFFLDSRDGGIWRKVREDNESITVNNLYSNIASNFYEIESNLAAVNNIGTLEGPETNLTTEFLYPGFALRINESNQLTGYYSRIDLGTSVDPNIEGPQNSIIKPFNIGLDGSLDISSVEIELPIITTTADTFNFYVGDLEYVGDTGYGIGSYADEITISDIDRSSIFTIDDANETASVLFDVTGGTSSLSATLGFPLALAANSDNVLYTSLGVLNELAESPPYTNTIVEINLDTQVSTVIGSVVSSGNINSLAFDSEGTLYAGIENDLYTLDLGTLDLTFVREIDDPTPVIIEVGGTFVIPNNVNGLQFINGIVGNAPWELCYRPS